MPVSKRWPSGRSGAGRTLYGRQRASSSERANASPRCGPQYLYGEQIEHVGADGRHVDRAVRRVVHGVDPGERAGLVRELDDARGVDERADGVRGPREGDDARPRRELPCEVVVVERAVLLDLREADDDAEVALELEPGSDVRVVVEPRDDDLVALAELARRARA